MDRAQPTLQHEQRRGLRTRRRNGPSRVTLGTDGIDNDILAESKAAYFKMRDAHAGLGMGDCLGWVAGASRLASSCLGVQTGWIAPGCAADLVLMRYPLTGAVESSNLAGHWFFGINACHVDSVMVGGRWVVRERRFENPGVDRLLGHAAATAAGSGAATPTSNSPPCLSTNPLRKRCPKRLV